MICLKFATPSAWIETVMANFDSFLIDHAAAEKKGFRHGDIHAQSLSRQARHRQRDD